MRHHPRADVGALDLRQLEHQRIADMLLLDRQLADQELARLAIMVGEAFGTHSELGSVLDAAKLVKPRCGSSRGPPISAPQLLGS
jgi:hypothetical protein